MQNAFLSLRLPVELLTLLCQVCDKNLRIAYQPLSAISPTSDVNEGVFGLAPTLLVLATIPASPTQTEIDAVNFILGAIGQAPVTTLEATNPDVAIAYDSNNTSKEVQSEGWTYNTEYHCKLVLTQ